MLALSNILMTHSYTHDNDVDIILMTHSYTDGTDIKLYMNAVCL